MLRDVFDRRTILILVGGLALITAGTVIGYSQFRCSDDLARDAPNADFSFEQNESGRTLTITHTGSGALLDADNRTNRGCLEEFEPDEVVISISADSANQSSQQYLWLARNGSGVGTLPLNNGDSVSLVEPEAGANGDIRLNRPLEQGDVIRVLGRKADSATTFGKYVVDSGE